MVNGVKPIEEAELDFGQVRSFHSWVLVLRTCFQSNVVLVIAGIHCRVVHRLASDVDISSVSCGSGKPAVRLQAHLTRTVIWTLPRIASFLV